VAGSFTPKRGAAGAAVAAGAAGAAGAALPPSRLEACSEEELRARERVTAEDAASRDGLNSFTGAGARGFFPFSAKNFMRSFKDSFDGSMFSLAASKVSAILT
jgi:hypothetical protein